MSITTGARSALFRSPTTTPCSIPPARTSPAACWKRCARTATTARIRPFEKAVDYLIRTQEQDGSWYGRWGVDYIYGTFLALRGLQAAGVSDREAYVQRALEWVRSIQNFDGGWGESCESYKHDSFVAAPSTPSQTAWAILALLAGGDTTSSSLHDGIDYLIRTQKSDGTWDEELATGTGFPQVFYLCYHLYRNSFPLLALNTFLKMKSAPEDQTK